MFPHIILGRTGLYVSLFFFSGFFMGLNPMVSCMASELRRDYFLDRQVIIAVDRGMRPSEWAVKGGDVAPGGRCFFCPGNEGMTPPEILRIPEGDGWGVRVFPNKFPAVTLDEGVVGERVMPAYGMHEVIVETPEHEGGLSGLSAERIAEVFGVYSSRVDDMLSHGGIEYALVFKNHGRKAGASLAHSHTQIISLPVVPPLVREEVFAAENYSHEHGVCPFCDMIRPESEGPRIIRDGPDSIVLAPYASRIPFEAWVMPKRHVGSLSDLDSGELLCLANSLRLVLSRLRDGLNNPAYNFYLHMSPRGEDLHLHFEVLPRLSVWAGFELGGQAYINTMPPELAAEFYRK
jgi:UDPglucose--hexose-1-phosphate uridylyltransferase